ncbi:MAG TPA: serine hydrolase [Caulobacteraceae bacterium]|jgi:beta-lactamase class A|nr:serine hydrolase [Caulobacteraceae bacterium]
MTLSRRGLITAAGSAAGLAACTRKPAAPRRTGPLDKGVLSRGLPGLMTQARPAVFDLAVRVLKDGETWAADGTGHYPLAGLSKLIVAAAALAEVDARRLRLNERVRITLEDLSLPPSRINERFDERGSAQAIDLPVADLVGLSVQQDDATASDVLLRRIGGPSGVTGWLHAKGLFEIRLDRSTRDKTTDLFRLPAFSPEWKSDRGFDAARHSISPAARQASAEAFIADSRDTTTAGGMLDFVTRLASGLLLSAASSAFLLQLMSAGSGDQSGMLAGLPAGSALARKDGATPTDLGYTAAQAEAGVITLPDGARLVFAAFLAGSTATRAARAKLLADAGRLIARSIGE